MQAIILFFVILATVYFIIDIMFLARQNDRLKRRLNRLEQDVRELRR